MCEGAVGVDVDARGGKAREVEEKSKCSWGDAKSTVLPYAGQVVCEVG